MGFFELNHIICPAVVYWELEEERRYVQRSYGATALGKYFGVQRIAVLVLLKAVPALAGASGKMLFPASMGRP